MTAIDVELMHAWMRADAPACCVALAKLGAKERSAALVQCEPGDLALLMRHAPVWWLNVVQTELPDLPWDQAIVEAGVDINVIRMLRGARREVREHRLANFPERQRARIARALVLPRDRVLSALDDRPSDCTPQRNRGHGTEPNRHPAFARRIVDLSGQRRRRLRGTGSDRRRRARECRSSDGRSSAGSATDTCTACCCSITRCACRIGRCTTVCRCSTRPSASSACCALVISFRALRLTDADANPRPVNLPILIIGSWAQLLVALMGRRRSQNMMLSDEVLNTAPDVAISVLTRQSEAGTARLDRRRHGATRRRGIAPPRRRHRRSPDRGVSERNAAPTSLPRWNRATRSAACGPFHAGGARRSSHRCRRP